MVIVMMMVVMVASVMMMVVMVANVMMMVVMVANVMMGVLGMGLRAWEHVGMVALLAPERGCRRRRRSGTAASSRVTQQWCKALMPHTLNPPASGTAAPAHPCSW